MIELGLGTTERELTLDSLPVEGRLPAWLEGTLLRNGPGAFTVGEQSYRHWFDGLAMLHRFSFQQGRVSYANKFLESRAYREAKETGRIAYSEFATDPCRSLFGRVMAVFQPKISDSAKVNLTEAAGRFMALAETPLQIEFDPDTLKSVGVFNYEDRLVGQMTTVHPHFDYERDEMLNVVTRYNRVSQYRLYRVAGGGAPQRAGHLSVNRPAYMHSFGMSQNYVILTEFPLVVNPLSLLLWLRPFIENFYWAPQRGAPFWLMNRHTGEVVARFESDPFFAFHHVNAFERGNELIVDLVAYPDAGIIQAFYLNRLKDTASQLPLGHLRRYRLPLAGHERSRRVDYELLSDANLELPRFDYRRHNMDAHYRYVYGVSVRPEAHRSFYNQLVKIDLQSGRSWRWFEPDSFPGEGVFVGAPARKAEDEGVVLSVVLDGRAQSSYLLVLDAQTFEERARARLPHPVLFGYHGDYFAASSK